MPARFLFVVCQCGAELPLKREVARQWPDFRFAYSRPGFVTFKLPAEPGLPEDFDLRCAFARTYGIALGNVQGDTAQQLAAAVWELAGSFDFDHIHVWQRDAAVPGDRGFEPGLTALAREAGQIIAAAMPATATDSSRLPVNRNARSGDRILDCVLVEPDRWWIGYHGASTMPSRWPGGTPQIELSGEIVSRAGLKMQEALLWSRLPIAPGDRCAEIGSAPGGSCQTLLNRGLVVTGIDPAEMDESVLAHGRFTHVRARGADLKRREFRPFKWLMVDSNVAPKHTLDTVEHIVTHRQVDIRGMLLTLKLPNWELADLIPEYLQRVRSWGYRYVNVRQLAFNRQEVCVAAMNSRRQRRPSRSKGKQRESEGHVGS
jgi:23S rRNA (cytidine2498-2'-O)-methyltransferase